MTAYILMNIRSNLDLSDKFQAIMWALFTMCFISSCCSGNQMLLQKKILKLGTWIENASRKL